MKIHVALRRIREALGMSVKEAADAAGIGTGCVYQIERGDRRFGPVRMARLADVLGIPPSMIVLMEQDCLFIAGSKEVMDVIWCLDEMERLEDRLATKMATLRNLYERERND